MKNLETIRDVQIDRLIRMNSRESGNPRFRVELANGLVSQTTVDDGLGYGIQNYVSDNRPTVDVEVGTHYGTVQIHRIFNVREAS